MQTFVTALKFNMHFCMDSDCDETPANCAKQLEQPTKLIGCIDVSVGVGFLVGRSANDRVAQVRTLSECSKTQ